MILENKNSNMKYKEFIKLGIQEAKNKNYNKSEDFFFNAINIDNKIPDAYLNLSNIYVLKENKNKGIKILEDYISLNKYNISIFSHLWKLYIRFKENKRIINFLKNLEDNDQVKNTNRYFLYYLIAKYYVKIENSKEAIKYFDKCLNFSNVFNQAYYDFFNFLERTNEINKLNIEIEKFKKISKNNMQLKYYESLVLNRLKKYKESENILNNYSLEKFFLDNNLYLNILNLSYANNEKLKNYEKALNFIRKRNLFLSNHESYKDIQKEDLSQIINHYKNVYSKKNFINKFQKIEKLPLKKINIAFLIGFPRSGTTLLDTILMTNQNTYVLEEKPYIRNVRDKYFAQNNHNLYSIENITKEEISELREYYFSQLDPEELLSNKLIIDKLPLTITELGFVKIIFPECKVILALRHPCDVVFSCYATSFKANEAMVNFLNIDDTIKFYDQVFNLFDYYVNELSIDYLKIKYENVVSNFEEEIKKLFNYLDLNYEKKISNFHKTAKSRGVISTPSYNQVSKPIYKTSINKWKKYEKYIKIKKKLTKWINKFDY